MEKAQSVTLFRFSVQKRNAKTHSFQDILNCQKTSVVLNRFYVSKVTNLVLYILQLLVSLLSPDMVIILLVLKIAICDKNCMCIKDNINFGLWSTRPANSKGPTPIPPHPNEPPIPHT